MQDEARRIQTIVAALVSQGADARRISDAALSTWRDLDAVLSPLIGQRGVAAIYARSLHLTSADYPWLAAVQVGGLRSGRFATLRTALSQQTASNAAAANSALLRTFCDLVASLLGESLQERLLMSIRDNPAGSHAAQAPLSSPRASQD